MTRETSPIVAGLMAGALESASNLARAQARFADRLKREAVQQIVDDFADWLEERDANRLAAAEVSMRHLGDGSLRFVSPRAAKPFEVRVRNARELLAGGRIVPVNALAVLDRELYADLVDRLLDWCGGGPTRRKHGAWGR